MSGHVPADASCTYEPKTLTSAFRASQLGQMTSLKATDLRIKVVTFFPELLVSFRAYHSQVLQFYFRCVVTITRSTSIARNMRQIRQVARLKAHAHRRWLIVRNQCVLLQAVVQYKKRYPEKGCESESVAEVALIQPHACPPQSSSSALWCVAHPRALSRAHLAARAGDQSAPDDVSRGHVTRQTQHRSRQTPAATSRKTRQKFRLHSTAR